MLQADQQPAAAALDQVVDPRSERGCARQVDLPDDVEDVPSALGPVLDLDVDGTLLRSLEPPSDAAAA